MRNSLSSNKKQVTNVVGGVGYVRLPLAFEFGKKYDTLGLTPLLKTFEVLGTTLSNGEIVVYESTVYLGCTEEDCVPVLDCMLGLHFNADFVAEYSLGWINPENKSNTLTEVKNVTSGSADGTADRLDNRYRSIIEAGTHQETQYQSGERRQDNRECDGTKK